MFELFECEHALGLGVTKRKERLDLFPGELNTVLCEHVLQLGHVDLAGAVEVNLGEHVEYLLVFLQFLPGLKVFRRRLLIEPLLEPVNIVIGAHDDGLSLVRGIIGSCASAVSIRQLR